MLQWDHWSAHWLAPSIREVVGNLIPSYPLSFFRFQQYGEDKVYFSCLCFSLSKHYYVSVDLAYHLHLLSIHVSMAWRSPYLHFVTCPWNISQSLWLWVLQNRESFIALLINMASGVCFSDNNAGEYSGSHFLKWKWRHNFSVQIQVALRKDASEQMVAHTHAYSWGHFFHYAFPWETQCFSFLKFVWPSNWAVRNPLSKAVLL